MNVKLRLQWFATFGILTGFTLVTLGSYAPVFAESPHQFIDRHLDGHSGRLSVYFEDRHGNDDREQYLCSISSEQLTAIQKSYAVKVETRKHGHSSYTIAIVSASSRHQGTHELKQIVGKRLARACRSHTSHSFLYLFTVPELS